MDGAAEPTADDAAEPGDYVVEAGDYDADGADTVVINTEAYSEVDPPGGPYGVDLSGEDGDYPGLGPAFYDEAETAVGEEYSAPLADADVDDVDGDRDSINWPTVALAAGMAGIVSAVVLAIAMVGLLLSEAASGNRAGAAAPQVVNLGAATLAPAALAPVAAVPAAPAQDVPAAEPVAEAAPAATAVAPAAVSSAAVSSAATSPGAGSVPATPTLGQFQSDLAVLRGGASNQEKGKLLEGGAPAAATLTKVLNYGKQFEPMGMGYRLVGPVKQNGATATARLELYAPGYQSNYLTMHFVWQDGRWKLTNKSVCELASFAQIGCNVR